MSDHRNPVDHPIIPALADRWSPYAFAPRSLEPGLLPSLLEAARWAPSSFNEQPWHYLVARREDSAAFERLLSCLMEANQIWARHASVLVVTVASLRFTRNGQPNLMARHDLGLASAQLTAEATSRGLVVHQMGGIYPDRARELYAIPEDFEAVTALAIGYHGDPAHLPEDLRERESAARRRRPLASFVFADGWGKPADLA